MYDAIILAGGENKKKFLGLSSQPYEALIEIAGQPMVAFVARALAASGSVNRIFVVGPEAELRRCAFATPVNILAGGNTIMETIQIGMAALGHRDKVLVATADIPLLTAEAVNDFLAQCSGADADFYYPIISKEMNERRFPATRRTYVRLREGTFTGGNIFLVNPDIVTRSLAVANRIIENRKRPLTLCGILGWGFVLNFLTGRLRLREVEQRVSELLKLRGAVVHSPYPELGIDVDKPSDLELVRAAIAGSAL
ncbi:MAG: nucleotidyltransferase family protein [Sporomusaceae bacterium]|nr:nucleotidyltransferase family protein [Sporomusaceae bacterium]